MVLAYNLLVVLWGAYVRATGSGAGCGAHWPLCNGVVVPRAPAAATTIEFTHRLMSGGALILVAILVLWAFRAYPRQHPVRLGAALSGIFLVTEALIGAGLVLFQWVAQNASLARAVSLSLHLVNTLTLLACLALTAWWASGGAPVRFAGPHRWTVAAVLGGMMVLGISGAIAALGDTLFPASSLAAGLRQDISPAVHFLLRLRMWHPVLAMLAGGFAAIASVRLRFGIVPLLLVFAQLIAGMINMVLLAPVWMQLVHLLLADLLWIALVLASARTLAGKKMYAI
jgi:heme A synthase